MGYKLEMNHPEFEKGVEFDVGGMLVPNGGSVELSDSDERRLILRHGASIKDALGNNVYLKVSGSSALSKKETDELVEVEPAPVSEEGGES